MKTTKKIIAGFMATFMLCAMSATAFAVSSYNSPAEAVAAITGKTIEDVIAERLDGKAYGTIASEAGKLKEFQAAILQMNQDTLDKQVADGNLAQSQADDAITSITQRQAVCNGAGMGYGYCGGGYGSGGGYSGGRGMGRCRR